MRKISGIFLALLLVLFPLCLTGCMNAAELKERTIIKMVGVDMDGEEYLLTVPIAEIYARAAEAKGVPEEVLQRAILDNYKRIFTGGEYEGPGRTKGDK